MGLRSFQGLRQGLRQGLSQGLGWVLAITLAPAAALAQDAVPVVPGADYAVASPAADPMDSSTADAELTPEEQEALTKALSGDPAEPLPLKAKSLRLPSLAAPKGLDASRTDRPDGSASMILKQPLPIDWDAKVGADLGLHAAPSLTSSPDPWKAGAADASGTGAAWASVGVLPSLATVDARVDPSNDQGRVGTTFKHSMPVGSALSVTLQNTYSVTETFGAFSPAAAQSDIPLTSLPVTATPGAITPQVWGSEKTAKFDILPTGTSFGAKLANNSTDPVTHNQFSAEQKIYGPLNITTAVTDFGQTTASKSITARFKLNW